MAGTIGGRSSLLLLEIMTGRTVVRPVYRLMHDARHGHCASEEGGDARPINQCVAMETLHAGCADGRAAVASPAVFSPNWAV